jgi:phosphatidate phosphatase APP1
VGYSPASKILYASIGGIFREDITIQLADVSQLTILTISTNDRTRSALDGVSRWYKRLGKGKDRNDSLRILRVI